MRRNPIFVAHGATAKVAGLVAFKQTKQPCDFGGRERERGRELCKVLCVVVIYAIAIHLGVNKAFSVSTTLFTVGFCLQARCLHS